jgi:hypothetical protein
VSQAEVVPPTPAGRPRRRWQAWRVRGEGIQLHWWRQVLVVLAVYAVFEFIRARLAASPERAFANAVRILQWQQAMGINHELAIQRWSLQSDPLILASNYFYATTWLVLTFGTLIWLYCRHVDAYRWWRNTLGFMAVLGLIGFAAFPLMPPRLLDVLGDGQTYGFVDTLVEHPTFWTVDADASRTVSNPFAAMPSLHCAWAIWVAAAVCACVQSRVVRGVAIAYPIVTVYTVVATGNHYFLDAVGGLLVFLFAALLARLVTSASHRTHGVHDLQAAGR